ncbi:MAG: FecR family protein [Ferruginibacter sp.]
MNKDRIWTLLSRKLSGEATASELIELNDLIQSQPNADLYLQVIDEYWKMPTDKDEEFLEATYHVHLTRLKEKGFDLEINDSNENPPLYLDHKTKSPSRKIHSAYLIAASAIALLAFLFSLLFFNNKNSFIVRSDDAVAQSEVSTKSGSRTKIRLPDGSSVWLNGSSKLVYDKHFGQQTREVTLIGEGYFDIVKNKNKPFIIHTSKINIKVLGTAFNVKAYPGEKNTETSLIRGSIEITMKGRTDKIMMKPNDKLIISNEIIPAERGIAINKKTGPIVGDSTFMLMGHLTRASDDNTIVETAWVENKLVFDNERFDEVALKMERWYGVSIRFMDDRLKTQRLTGTFEKETISEALMALQLSTPFFKYKINNQNINIFK